MTESLVHQIVDVLKTKVSEFKYNQWLRPTRFMIDGDAMKIEVPNKFIRDWIQDNYLPLIQYELFRLSNREFKIVFTVHEGAETSTALAGATQQILQQMGERAPNSSSATPAPARGAPHSHGSTSSHHPRSLQGFNSKYSFDTFVVGNSNQFCHAAALSVADHPGKTYNPLFIYGGVGLGKTHVLNAIGLKIAMNDPKKRIVSVTGEQFTNELINAIRYETTYEFRRKYRESCDILLIDDVQFISGKERTQEEFFHTFNTLYDSRRQIILTSDRPPKDIRDLEERLRSRFNWGLIADIQAPDTETRVAILQRRAESLGVALPNDIAYLVAEQVRTNIRDLEGAFNRLSAFSLLSKSEMNPALVIKILSEFIKEKQNTLSVERIQELVAIHYNVKVDDLVSERRFKAIAEPRQIAMYLCKKLLKASFPEIGQKFGGKDHSTVIHAVQKITKAVEQNTTMQTSISAIEKSLSI